MLEMIISHVVDISKLPKDPIIIDAGACWGEFSLGLMKFIDGKYYCLECDNINYSKLLEIPNINPEYCALVGDENLDKATCYSYNSSHKRLIGWSNITNLYSNHRHVENTTVLDSNVPVTTIKKLIEKYNLPRIDYLKLDVEGMEFEVLMNMPKDILTSIPQICYEYHRGDDNNFYILKDYLESNGFKTSMYPCYEVFAYRE